MSENLKLPPSKYLPFYAENAEWLQSISQLTGDLLVVERVVFPERKVGSLYIAPPKPNQVTGFSSQLPLFFRVLHVGSGYYDDITGEDKPLDIERGDIVLASGLSVHMYSSIPMLDTADSDVIGLLAHANVQWRFKGEAEFLAFLERKNSAVSGAGK